MSSLGELYFALGLDDKKFNEALEAAKKKVAELGADVTVGIKIDTESIGKQIKAEFDKIQGGGNVKIGIDDSNLKRIREDLAKAKAELAELNSAKFKNTSDIGRKEGWIKTLEIQEQKELARLQTASKPVKVDVELNQEAVAKVRQQLSSLENPIKTKISVEYDNEKFQAATTALKNYTDQLNNIGKIRLGIDDSFLRTGAGFEKGKGIKGFLSNVSDYLLGDDTGEANRSIGQIQKILNNYTFKLKTEVDQQLLINSLNAISKKKVSLNVGVNMDIAAIQKKLNALKVPLTLNSKQAIDDIKSKLKNETFKAKLNLVIDKAKVSKAVKAALERQGLNYNTTPSDVRAKRIDEIQQRMELRQKKFDGQVNKSVSSTNRLGSSIRNASNWAGQLSNQFNNFISIYSMERFIRNLYTIGGEFQKQQIALQNMIGDVDKGNAIFERMKDLAVKSPFTFSDLASYTKQMSAYGIEYENLYDTTKRLADISAGVGVDMGRLILAFGQVRSAAVLRGQELRQFTEAGIPLVAELAKKFTELEGKAVSTGEVFDKISKREVSFGMVKDILYDMTDPGGRFFETQEKLAESLAGKWSNLKDAWDIMIADIANGNNTVLSGLADMLNSLIRGFETWLPFVSGAVVAFGLLKGAISAVNIVTSVNPWVLLGTVIAGATSSIVAFVSETETVTELVTRLNRELESTVAKNADNERNANRYLDILKQQANTEDEKLSLEKKQKKAFEELLELYPKAIEVEELELMTLEEIEKTRKRIAEQTKNETLSAYDKRIDDAYFAYNEKRIEANRIAREAGLTIDSFPETKKELDDLYDLYTNAMNAKENYEQSLIDSLKPIKREEWMLKAEEIIAKYPNISIRKPSNEDRYTYFDYLEEQFKDAKDKYERTVTSELRKPQKSIMDAFNAVNMAIGGKSFYDKKKKGGKTPAEEAAERDAKAYYDTLKTELTKISSQWDLYKEIFDVTGNKTLALNLAFDGKIPGFDNYIDHLKGEMAKEVKKRGLGITPDELLSMGKEGIASKVNDKTATSWTEDVAKNLNLLIDRYNQAGNKLRKESIDNFLEIIKASKDFAQQIEDEANNLQRALNTIYSMPIPIEEKRRMEAQAYDNYEEKVAEINFEKFKKTSGWVKIFDDLTKVSTGTLDGLLVDIEEFLPQGVESEEVFKALIKAIRDIKDELLERNPFRAFGADVNSELGEINDKIKEYNRQIREAKKNGNIDLVKSLEDKKHEEESRRKEIYDNYSTAFKHGMDKISEFANAVGEVSSMLEKFGNESLKNFGQFLDSITSGMQSGFNVGSLFGGVGGVVGGFVGAATGAMAGLVDAGRKAVAAEQERSQIVIDRLEKVASLLKEKIADSLTGLYNSTLDATSRMEMTLQKEKYDAAEKYYKDKGEDINPNSWYATTFDNTSFSWDTNEYLIYSKKTHEAINKALEADNEYMAMYASLLAQRDEMLYQKATYTDKDSEDVEAFKRDKDVEIEKITMEIEQLSKDMMSSLYSVDFQDWASQLADSIVNAWAAGEDAAKAYEGTVSDIMRNVATSLVKQRIIGEYLKKNLDPFIDEFIAKNGIMEEEMFSTLGDIVDGVGDRTDDALKFMDSLEKVMNEKGLTLKDLSDSSEKGGLSKGIQSVTEDTADLLASYLNATRQDVSVNRSLLERLIGEDVPKMNYIAEAQLRELSLIQSNTAKNVALVGEIRDLVNRVIDKGSNKLKV